MFNRVLKRIKERQYSKFDRMILNLFSLLIMLAIVEAIVYGL